MSDKFAGKYRNESTRLQSWNYGNNGAYFLTICTSGKEPFFGHIENGKMQYSPAGEQAHQLWKKIPEQFDFIELGEFIIMPDHIHGILIVNHPAGFNGDIGNGRNAINRVPTGAGHTTGGITGNKNPMLHENISRVVRWYKGRCSFEIRKVNPQFKWQSRFYDSIIRNSLSHERINQYIRNNPVNWGKNKLKGIL